MWQAGKGVSGKVKNRSLQSHNQTGESDQVTAN